MIKIRKSNRIIYLLLVVFLLIFISQPKIYMQATLNGATVWFFNVFPSLFPFFIATKLLISLNVKDVPILNQFTSKLFKVTGGGKIFLLSLLSGYPVGAKLICNAYNQGQLDLKSAKKMMSFCSVSGPMFIIGTVGIGVFKSVKIGYILLLTHIIGAIINGLVFRNSYKKLNSHNIANIQTIEKTEQKNLLAETMMDSIISILLVGGYIIFAFVLIELLNNIGLIPLLSSLLKKIIPFFNQDAISSFLNGIIEMTNGVISISATNVALKTQISLSSFLIAFGGFSIFTQSLSFTRELQIKKSFYLFQKFCQGIFTMILTIFVVNLFY